MESVSQRTYAESREPKDSSSWRRTCTCKDYTFSANGNKTKKTTVLSGVQHVVESTTPML